jgi:hypothetical protein
MSVVKAWQYRGVVLGVSRRRVSSVAKACKTSAKACKIIARAYRNITLAC